MEREEGKKGKYWLGQYWFSFIYRTNSLFNALSTVSNKRLTFFTWAQWFKRSNEKKVARQILKRIWIILSPTVLSISRWWELIKKHIQMLRRYRCESFINVIYLPLMHLIWMNREIQWKSKHKCKQSTLQSVTDGTPYRKNFFHSCVCMPMLILFALNK